MKKILIFIVIGFFALPISAQIQRQILGYTLGVSTKSTVLNGLQNKGFNVELVPNAIRKGAVFYNVTGGVSFGGYIWDNVRIGFINGKFATIWFSTYLTEQQASKIKRNLQSKYRRFSTSHTNPEAGEFDYTDRRTNVSFFIHSNMNSDLMYGDRNLEENTETNSSSSSNL